MIGTSLVAVICAVSFAVANSDTEPDDLNGRVGAGSVETVDDGGAVGEIVKGCSADYKPAESVHQMASVSSVVIIGVSEQTNEVINLSAHPKNPPVSHPDSISLGRVYEIKVSEYLKGAGPETVHLVQYEAYISLDRESPDLQELASRKADSCIEPVRPGQEHIFFLREWPWNREFYVPAIEPYRFVLTEGRAEPKGNLKDASSALPVEDADELLALLREIL